MTKEYRNLFTEGDTYSASNICLDLKSSNDEYVTRLLEDRLRLVSRYSYGGTSIDLCCATGVYTLKLANFFSRTLGIDFSNRYIEKAIKLKEDQKATNVDFLAADARKLPVISSSVDFLVCFSSLYVIPNPEDVIRETSRVLKTGGIAVLDFGNINSLNVFCAKHYTDVAPMEAMSLKQILSILEEEQLAIKEHKSYQILPLWADKPPWLRPLLHPFWQKFLKIRLFDKMLDEWFSSLPLVRHFSFRHLIVVEKKED